MTDTMLFGVLKMPFEMAMKDEISRIQFYARVQELVGRFEAQQQAEPVADGDKVICPACCHQFRGIPETVQTLMLHAGFEPPFTTPPQQQAEPVTREGFEKWAKFAAPYMDISRFEAGYSDCNTDYAWVGWQAAQRKELSASEILNMMPSGIPAEYDGELMEFARAVEAKLKERNA